MAWQFNAVNMVMLPGIDKHNKTTHQTDRVYLSASVISDIILGTRVNVKLLRQ